MSKKVSYIITDHNITVNYDGQTHIIPRKDSLANQLIDAIKSKNLDEIPRLVEVSKRVEVFGKGNFEVRDEQILVNGVVAPNVLSSKILRFMNEGLPVEPLIKFTENLLKNPSYRAVNELFQFLEKNDHPITDNGCFIAYKKVRSDFKDAYTGTIDNSPGAMPEVPRNQVDEDSTKTCSKGLHVANWNYAKEHYNAGDNPVMLEVEVNPADVVAIPIDYDQSKMRVCRYTVLGVVDREHSSDISLRKGSNPPVNVSDTDEKENEEEIKDCCGSCGADLCSGEVDLCEFCENDLTCENCGCEIPSYNEGICDACLEEEEEEEEYPWEDEIEEE